MLKLWIVRCDNVLEAVDLHRQGREEEGAVPLKDELRVILRINLLAGSARGGEVVVRG